MVYENMICKDYTSKKDSGEHSMVPNGTNPCTTNYITITIIIIIIIITITTTTTSSNSTTNTNTSYMYISVMRPSHGAGGPERCLHTCYVL